MASLFLRFGYLVSSEDRAGTGKYILGDLFCFIVKIQVGITSLPALSPLGP